MAPTTGNWGKWGAADERGSVNYITPETMVKASRLVRKGRIYQLAIPLDAASVPKPDAGVPLVHLMARDGGDYAAGVGAPSNVQSARDFIMMSTHYGTHIDALSHVWYDGVLYNNFSGNTVTSGGASRCGVESIGPIFTRGILLDVLSLKKTEHLPSTYVITPDDLEECARLEGVSCESGDALLIRTGRLNDFKSESAGFYDRQPGLGIAAASWIAGKEFCVVGADNVALEAVPWDGAGKGSRWPVHVELMRNFGIPILEFLDLEALARDRI